MYKFLRIAILEWIIGDLLPAEPDPSGRPVSFAAAVTSCFVKLRRRLFDAEGGSRSGERILRVLHRSHDPAVAHLDHSIHERAHAWVVSDDDEGLVVLLV